MKVSGMGFSSQQRSLWLCCNPCPEKSKCTAELSAGCRRPPWRETTAWRSASDHGPSTAGRTRWGRRTSASWRMWCSTPGDKQIGEKNLQQMLQSWMTKEGQIWLLLGNSALAQKPHAQTHIYTQTQREADFQMIIKPFFTSDRINTKMIRYFGLILFLNINQFLLFRPAKTTEIQTQMTKNVYVCYNA